MVETRTNGNEKNKEQGTQYIQKNKKGGRQIRMEAKVKRIQQSNKTGETGNMEEFCGASRRKNDLASQEIHGLDPHHDIHTNTTRKGIYKRGKSNHLPKNFLPTTTPSRNRRHRRNNIP